MTETTTTIDEIYEKLETAEQQISKGQYPLRRMRYSNSGTN